MFLDDKGQECSQNMRTIAQDQKDAIAQDQQDTTRHSNVRLVAVPYECIKTIKTMHGKQLLPWTEEYLEIITYTPSRIILQLHQLPLLFLMRIDPNKETFEEE